VQSLVIDNFLPYPDVVRTWALSHEYLNSEQFSAKHEISTSWPGIRTDHVVELDKNYANTVLSQIANISGKFFSHSASIKSYFQVCTQSDGDSWIHQDNDVDLAGILYLSPNAPISSGTTLYRCNDIEKWSNLSIQTMKKINRFEDSDLYNSIFTPTDVFGNIYNRLVLYRGDIFHKSNDYFGLDKYSGRLTQVFFIKFE